MPNYALLKDKFVLHFGKSDRPLHTFYAPGRVNLIGEHTDYNGGYVFPAALTLGTTLLIRERQDKKIGLLSTNVQKSGELELTSLKFEVMDEWMNYPKGVIKQLIDRGVKFNCGYDLLYHGEIPNGAGLSSSASIEVVTMFALMTMLKLPIDCLDIALSSQKTENEFIGVQCGIMDQFAVTFGKKDHALLLMCETMAYEYIPFQTNGYKLIIVNTNKRRDLVDSKYNERRMECEQALSIIKTIYTEVTSLCQITPKQLVKLKDKFIERTIYNRAKHVIDEHDRVMQSVEALKQNDLLRFGQLMKASHLSLRDLYEVTGKELDSLYLAAEQAKGVIGTRMTGAGFGGCTISLVHESCVRDFITTVGADYYAYTSIKADFYVCEIGNGVVQID